MNQVSVIICERSGRWATAIERRLPTGTRLRQSRSLGECALRVAESPEGLVILELTPRNFAGVWEFLVELPSKFPRARALVVAERGLEELEWPLREVGAIHFTCSPRELEGVAGTVRNHLDRLPASRSGFAAQIWEALPWGDVATA